jgi:hypothetical protein
VHHRPGAESQRNAPRDQDFRLPRSSTTPGEIEKPVKTNRWDHCGVHQINSSQDTAAGYPQLSLKRLPNSRPNAAELPAKICRQVQIPWLK